jgi:hypothetical protein
MTCSGYRNQQSLMFRDESKRIFQKGKGSNQLNETLRLNQTQSSSSKDAHWLQHSNGPLSTVSSSPRSLLGERTTFPPSLDRGIEFFYDNYITFISCTPTGRAALPASPAWRLLFTNPAYSSACSAAGYAGLSNITRDPTHMITARKQYASSLRAIEGTMKDESKLAMSFESAMILTVFEIVIAGSWGVHVQGGAAIWKMMAAHGQTPSPRTQLFYVFFIVSVTCSALMHCS